MTPFSGPDKNSPKNSPEMCHPSPKGGIGKKVQKRGVSLWRIGRISSRQPLLSADPFSKLLKEPAGTKPRHAGKILGEFLGN